MMKKFVFEAKHLKTSSLGFFQVRDEKQIQVTKQESTKIDHKILYIETLKILNKQIMCQELSMLIW